MISVKTSFLNFFEVRARRNLSIMQSWQFLARSITKCYSRWRSTLFDCYIFLTRSDDYSKRVCYRGIYLFFFVVMALNPKVVRAQMIGGVDLFSAPGSSAAQSASHFELSQNPAGISGTDLTWSGFRLFGMSELESVGFSGSYVGKSANIAIELHRFGFDLYQENNVIVGSSIHIQSDTKLGLGIGYQQVGIKGYGSSGVEYINLGVIHRLSNKLSIGGAVRNLVLNRHGSFRVGLQSDILFGASYSAFDQLYMHLAFLKSPTFDTQALMGFSWQPVEVFKLMGGYITVSEEWSVSAAVKMFGLEIRYGAREHEVLGWSQGIGLTYLW